MDGKYFKIKAASYYYAQSFQFMQGSPDAGPRRRHLRRHRVCPTRTRSRSSRASSTRSRSGGFHNTFAYKHSDGRVLYFVTVNDVEGGDL